MFSMYCYNLAKKRHIFDDLAKLIYFDVSQGYSRKIYFLKREAREDPEDSCHPRNEKISKEMF